MKLFDETIREIADFIDAGLICYVNPETGEMEAFTEEDDLEIDLSENDNEEDDEFNDFKAQILRVDSWDKFVIIRKPDSSEAFRFMENFVEEVIPENEQKIYWKALSWKKPFANFKDLINDSEHREDWNR